MMRYAATNSPKRAVAIANGINWLALFHPPTSVVFLMRLLALTISSLVTVGLSFAADAQTFGGSSPFCLEKWGWGGIHNISCSYSSMAQCHETASGLSAMCRSIIRKRIEDQPPAKPAPITSLF